MSSIVLFVQHKAQALVAGCIMYVPLNPKMSEHIKTVLNLVASSAR